MQQFRNVIPLGTIIVCLVVHIHGSHMAPHFHQFPSKYMLTQKLVLVHFFATQCVGIVTTPHMTY